jgi:acetyltransferase-like isoleucine patch superfamily enzyme
VAANPLRLATAKAKRYVRSYISATPPERLDKRLDLAPYSIGRYSWGHLWVSNPSPDATLKVGQFCSFAHGVRVLLGGEHRTEFVSTYRFPAYDDFRDAAERLDVETTATRGDVTIGNDVWLGTEAVVLSGVTIGHGAVVGAASVVRQDLPPYAIALGNPARVAGFRFPPEQIEALLRIAWWDWPIEEIKSALGLMMSDDIQKFIDHYDTVRAE